MIFHFLIVQVYFVFLLIEFNHTFSISYKILSLLFYFASQGVVDGLYA